MPRLSVATCGGMMPTPVASKYRAAMGHMNPACAHKEAAITMDLGECGWKGVEDSVSMSLSYLGRGAFGVPAWRLQGAWDECWSDSQPVTMSCPPGPMTIPCSVVSQCCSSTSSGYMLAAGGVTDSTGDPIDLMRADECGCCPTAPNTSCGPVRYATGEAVLGGSDLQTRGFGLPWGHARTFTARQTVLETMGGGYGWQASGQPFLTIRRSTHPDTLRRVESVTLQGSGNGRAIRFQRSGDKFITQFDLRARLTHNTATQQFEVWQPDGTRQYFHDQGGQLLKQVAPNGVTAEVSSSGAAQTVERVATVDGHTVTERLLYNYAYGSGDGLITELTRQRRIDNENWQNIQRVLYTYYGFDEEFGLDEDLKTVTTQVWVNTDWLSTGTTYYRWHVPARSSSSSSSSSSSGNEGLPILPWDKWVHLPVYVLEPGSFERLKADPNVTDPFTAPNSIVAQYADNRFEYDDDRRVIVDSVRGGSLLYQFSYFNGGYSGYNFWKSRTTETRPDGSRNIVYANFAGQTILFVRQSGDDEWCDFYVHDNRGRVVLHARPSAVTGYDEAYPDLLHEVGGAYEFLRDDAGLIRTYTYHDPSNFLASESVQQGQSGTPVLLREMEYVSCHRPPSGSSSSSSSSSSASSSSSSSSGGSQMCDDCVWFLSRETVYRSDSNPALTQVTTHGYSFHDGTCAVQERVTTLPVVATDQNGSGVAATRRDHFDIYGNLTWTMDERGYLARRSYDIPTGGLIQEVADVDTSLYSDVPAGWSTPSGGGKNLVTDLEVDDQGRVTQTLGPVHTISLPGGGTAIRTADWIVRDDVNHVLYAARGLAFGTGPDYDYTLTNPVSITRMDAGGRVNEQIQAAAPDTSGTLAEIIAAAGGASAAFPQSSYTRWSTMQYTECCLLASQRAYHAIPASGEGSSGTNYDQTDYGYDTMKRHNRTVSPGGEITFVVYDVRDNILSAYVGTNDDGATETDPTGGGADPDNNMKLVTANEYDGGTAGGDGNLTEQTDYVHGTVSRVATFAYDFRNRPVTTTGEVDYFQKSTYDNLDRVVKSERYNTSAAGNLIARGETKFDDRGRVYQTLRYAVDPATGTVGNVLTGNLWYDAADNLIKALPAGSKLFTKRTFDSLNRPTAAYKGYDLDETAYADAFSVSDDVILEQVETVYDNANNVIQTTTRQRYHNAPDSQTGPLQNPGTTPKARVTYAASYPDALGRLVATADYGTNGGATFTRPDTIPDRSDTVLVGSVEYDSTGQVLQTTDPKGIVTRYEHDDRGREITLIENYRADSSSSSSSSSSSGGCEPSDDTNRTTRKTYSPDGLLATLIAENARTAPQITTYTHGTTLANSDLATSTLLRQVAYPDSSGGTDVVSFTYNRQRERKSAIDQRGCVHSYDRDLLGRLTHDRVTTLGGGVDGAIRRLSATYDVRGLPSTLTSYSNATVGSGSVVNQVLFAYNGFAQVTHDYQSHAGSVNTGTSPRVGLTYANGSANTIRPMSLVYPDGRTLTYDYGTTNGINDAVSRVEALVDDDGGSTHLADYSFLGLGATVVVDFTEPDVKYTLVDLSGTNDPDTGDIYSGLDRFGRVKDCRWRNYGNNTDTARLKYGYDRASNRLWREDTVATSQSKNFDELYSYDNLHRLADMKRGRLNSGHTALTTTTFTQAWTLDATGNWQGFEEAATGGSLTLEQTRTSNTANEITDITNSIGSPWADPAHDAAGNMTTIPKPADPTASFTATYDAWNRQVKLVNTSNSQTVQECQYDPRTFRTIRKDYTAGTLSEERHCYYTPGWRCIEERLGSSPDTATPDRQFVWGTRYIDDLVCRDRSVSGTLDERLYAEHDANWNVVALTDTSGTVQERYAYDPYGKTTVLDPSFTARASSSYQWETTFCGYRFDVNSGLLAVRFRVYHPVLGCWVSRDPIGYADGMSLYAAYFVLGGVDPHGLSDSFLDYHDVPSVEYESAIHCHDRTLWGPIDFSGAFQAFVEGQMAHGSQLGETIGKGMSVDADRNFKLEVERRRMLQEKYFDLLIEQNSHAISVTNGIRDCQQLNAPPYGQYAQDMADKIKAYMAMTQLAAEVGIIASPTIPIVAREAAAAKAWWLQGVEMDAAYKALPLREKFFHDLGQITMPKKFYEPRQFMTPLERGHSYWCDLGPAKTFWEMSLESARHPLGIGATFDTGPSSAVRIYLPHIAGAAGAGGAVYYYLSRGKEECNGE